MTEPELAKLLLLNNGNLTPWIDTLTGGLQFNFFQGKNHFMDIEPALIEEEWEYGAEEFYSDGYTKDDIEYKDWESAITDNLDIYADNRSFEVLETYFDSSTLMLPHVVKYIKDQAHEQL